MDDLIYENIPQINPNPVAQDNDETSLHELDILDIFINFVPSTIYCTLISLILIFSAKENLEEYYSQIYHIMLYLKIILVIYALYVLKSLFYYFVMTKNKIKNPNSRIIIDIFYLLLDISYFVFTIAGDKSYKKLSLDYIINNIYKCIFIYSLIFIGYVHLFMFFINGFYLIIMFIFKLFEFLGNENRFIQTHGGLFYILEPYLVKTKADESQTDTCPICLIDIQSGDEIITLKCSSKHYFHSGCIIKWLQSSFCCPLCKSNNII